MTEHLVVDASPLIVLGRIDQLDLLPALAQEVVVPRAVLVELRMGSDRDNVADAVETAQWAKSSDDVSAPQSITTWELGAGETQVLAFAIAHENAQAVLDDAAARRCAAAVGITTIGTLGLVLRAKARGLIPNARPLVERLRDAGLYITEATLTRALALVGE